MTMTTTTAPTRIPIATPATYPPVHWIASFGADRPSFSRDGTRVVYQNLGTGALYIVDSGGGVPWQLLAATRELQPSRPDWSWSPETIAFGGASGGRSTIWLIDSDGRNLRELAGMGHLSHSIYPSWYQDLEHIVVMDTANPSYSALWRLTVDGSEDPVQLTTMDDFCAGRPSAAPGGARARVAFAGTEGPFNQQNNQIWVTRRDSLKPCQLNPEQGRSPNWSPDGKWILFESNRLTGPTGNYQIFVAPAPVDDGPDPCANPLKVEPVALTDPSYMAQHAEWSRQQDRIVFETGNGKVGVFKVPEQFRMSRPS
jgi:Tol biopolymer transport system component